MEEVLSLCQETLKKFLLSLSKDDQHIVSLEARTTFLKNPTVREAYYHVPDDKENKADDNTVIINNEEETSQVGDVPQDQDDVRSNYSSPHVKKIISLRIHELLLEQ